MTTSKPADAMQSGAFPLAEQQPRDGDQSAENIDPFVSFTEWEQENDRKAYADF